MRYDSPIRLKSERAWRTYTGGRLIDELHGIVPARDTHFPEDWIISTVRAINPGREDVVEGLSWLAGENLTLKAYIEADPAAALGAAHVAKWGASPAVLLKLIDAAERLGIQVHPDGAHAQRFFGSRFGKTECWYILGGRTIDGEPPCVYMGFRPGITNAAWRGVFERQDVPAMLSMLHRIETRPGDCFLVRGGVPHAIGKGCLLMEIQEPTDFTLRTEKVTPQGFAIPDASCHYGIGFDRMFECFAYDGVEETEGRARWMVQPKTMEERPGYLRQELVGYGETPCFALERHTLSPSAGACAFARSGAFSGLYVLAGVGTLVSSAGSAALRQGDQFFVPAASDDFEISATAPLTIFQAKSAK